MKERIQDLWHIEDVMSFGATLAHPRGQEAVICQQDSELKLLDGVKKFIQQRVKADRDYATALLSMVSTAQKLDAVSVATPLYAAWCTIVSETEKIAKLLREGAENVQNHTLERLTESVAERRVCRKAFQEDKARLESEYSKYKDEVHDQKCGYLKTMNKAKSRRAEFEEAEIKGRTANKIDDQRKKYVDATERLHRCHNDYVLSVEEAKLYEDTLQKRILPAMLSSQQMEFEHHLVQSKEILGDYLARTNMTCAEYSTAHLTMTGAVDDLNPETEYQGFLEIHKASPEPYDFKFEERTHDGYSGTLEVGVIAVDDLTHNSLIEWKADYASRRDTSVRETAVQEQRVKEAQKSVESLSKTTAGSGNELFRKTRELRALERDQLEEECEGQRFTALQTFIEKKLSSLTPNGSIPSGLSTGGDSGSASIHNGHNGSKTSLTNKQSASGEEISGGGKTETLAPKSTAKQSLGDRLTGLMRGFPKPGKSSSGSSSRARPQSEADVKYEPTRLQRDGSSSSAEEAGGTVKKGSPGKGSFSSSEHTVTSPSGQVSVMTTDAYQPLEDELWFHGILPREEVQRLLKEDGDYLVRESKKKVTGESQYVLSVMWQGPKHFIIQVNEDGHWRLEGQSFPSVQLLLIQQHRKGAAVTNKSQAILYRPIMREEWQIRNDDVTRIEKIGNGNFGEVYKGEYKGDIVAVKTCKEDLSEDQKKKFIQEGRILRQYDHPNIVRFVGIAAQKNPVMILMEFVSGGALLSWLRKRGTNELKSVLIKACLDAASGMEYLESKNVIHRDLAARNCLIASESKVVKISDFGMSREEETYQVSGGLRQIPIKWTAPEALNYGTYTSLCDVWSYGILMWEIFSAGRTPYPGMKNQEARTRVDEGYRMSCPENCSPDIFQIMEQCWEVEPERRPHFADICERLRQALPNHTNS